MDGVSAKWGMGTSGMWSMRRGRIVDESVEAIIVGSPEAVGGCVYLRGVQCLAMGGGWDVWRVSCSKKNSGEAEVVAAGGSCVSTVR